MLAPIPRLLAAIRLTSTHSYWIFGFQLKFIYQLIAIIIFAGLALKKFLSPLHKRMYLGKTNVPNRKMVNLTVHNVRPKGGQIPWCL